MDFARWLEHLPWVVWLTGDTEAISIVWLFHFLGFFLAVGTTAMVDLRILGVAGRRLTVSQMGGLLFPWTWVGIAFATISGFLMFAGYAVQEYPAFVFRLKIFLYLAAILFGYLVQRNVPERDGMTTPSSGAKVLALVSLLLWIGVILVSVEVPAFIACI